MVSAPQSPEQHRELISTPQQGRSGVGVGFGTTVGVILIVLWLLGLVSGYTLGSFIYILLLIGIILITTSGIVRLFNKRKAQP